MILALMQNGWSPHYVRIGRPGEVHDRESHREAIKARVWPRERWIDATWSCKTGQNLRKILHDIPEELIWLDDTTLELADKASGVKRPDLDHVVDVIHDRHITMVVACGAQAGRVINSVWTGPVVKIPHPAVRGIGDYALKCYNGMIRNMLARFVDRRLLRVAMDVVGMAAPLWNDDTPFGDHPDWLIPRKEARCDNSGT